MTNRKRLPIRATDFSFCPRCSSRLVTKDLGCWGYYKICVRFLECGWDSRQKDALRIGKRKS